MLPSCNMYLERSKGLVSYLPSIVEGTAGPSLQLRSFAMYHIKLEPPKGAEMQPLTASQKCNLHTEYQVPI